jgi:uncharacterized lipoprotein YddW (UPF0748 family)
MAASFLSMLSPAGAAEFRGIWVDAFHPGFKTPEQTTEMVNKVADANLNAIFVQVRKRGDAYYNSTIVPKASDIAADYDPLADIIQKAHARGVEVHAWITVYEVWNTKYKSVPEGHVYALHPEWLTKNDQGAVTWFDGKVSLDPGIPSVRAHIRDIALDIVTKYNVEGLNLEGVWYPSIRGGYNDRALELFRSQYSRADNPGYDDPDWCDWRRSQLTTLVTQVYSAVTLAKPNVKVTAAAFADKEESKAYMLQDWDPWTRDGVVDAVITLSYTEDNAKFASYVQACTAAGSGRHVYIGQGAWQLPAASSIAQLEIMRNTLGGGGFVLFSYAYVAKPDAEGISPLQSIKGALLPSAVERPAMNWKN